MSFGRTMSRGMKGACGARCRSFRARIIPTSYVPILSCYFSPLSCLFFPFLMTCACVLVPVSSFVTFRVHCSQWFVSWTKHYLTLGLAVGKEHVQAGSALKFTNPAHFFAEILN